MRLINFYCFVFYWLELLGTGFQFNLTSKLFHHTFINFLFSTLVFVLFFFFLNFFLL